MPDERDDDLHCRKNILKHVMVTNFPHEIRCALFRVVARQSTAFKPVSAERGRWIMRPFCCCCCLLGFKNAAWKQQLIVEHDADELTAAPRPLLAQQEEHR